MLFLVFPLLDSLLPQAYRIIDQLRPIFILSLLGLGLNILTGFTGLLNLGIAAFMAIGAYSFAILSCDIYPFQLGFWGALLGAAVCGGISGIILGLPTLRLRGDYLAIVTLGFGEIVQDVLRNTEEITRGTQGINPLPPPVFFGFEFETSASLAWYYFLGSFVLLAVALIQNLENSRIGRSWVAIREDELAARSMGLAVFNLKLLAFAAAAAVAAISGALWAGFLGSSGEPANYDFQISIMALCMVIIGGLGSVRGVLLGALIMVGFNSIVLVRLSETLGRLGFDATSSVYASPVSWKYFVFGFALVLMMRFRPEGLLPSARLRAELAERSAP